MFMVFRAYYEIEIVQFSGRISPGFMSPSEKYENFVEPKLN